MARAKTRSSTASHSRGKTGSSSSRSSSGSRRGGTARKSTATATRRGAGGRAATRGRAPTPRRRGSAAGRDDAIALLKNDHRTVEDLFAQFEKARTDERKKTLATNVCMALRVHSSIEEEIFYPAFLEATRDEDKHHEAIIEHDGVKKLIAEIESSGPGDEYFGARMKVMAEMVRHHVQEEERRDGILAQAKSAGLDLRALGEQMAQRKAQLEAEPEPMKTAKQLKDAGKGLLSRLASAV